MANSEKIQFALIHFSDFTGLCKILCYERLAQLLSSKREEWVCLPIIR